MGDRLFAAEGDSLNIERSGTSARTGQWVGERTTSAGGSDAVDAAAVVARRLQGRLDRHRWLLERLRSDGLSTAPTELTELVETAARMRRDTESLLMLCGRDPRVRHGGRRRLSDVLIDAAAAAAEPGRVEIPPAPAATVEPVAALELLHVVAELVDHLTTGRPGMRVELVSVVEARGGITVGVTVDGADHPDSNGARPAADAAALLARHSRCGIELRLESVTPSMSGQRIASVVCPADAVSLEGSARPQWPAAADRARRQPGHGADRTGDGNELFTGLDDGFGGGLGDDLGSGERTEPGNGVRFGGWSEPGNGGGFGDGTGLGRGTGLGDRSEPDRGAGESADADDGDRPGTSTGPGDGAAAGSTSEVDSREIGDGSGGDGRHSSGSAPAMAGLGLPIRPPLPSRQVDELFGPLADLPVAASGDHSDTPIYEAIASAWFQRTDAEAAHGRHGSGPVDWESPYDEEWRAAAARVAHPQPDQTTAAGLPQRRPGHQLVPPRRSQDADRGPAERVPDRVRDRLATYQRGLQQGRHRAADEQDAGTG